MENKKTVATTSAKKRQRSENWLADDKHLLTAMVRERVHDIENKNTDTNTNAKKMEAWKDLCSSFNSMCNGSSRTIGQLKNQWNNIKIVKKKERSFLMKQIFKPEGGPPSPVEDENDIEVWLPGEFINMNEFDSDTVNQKKVPEAEGTPEASNNVSKSPPRKRPRQKAKPANKKENENKTVYMERIVNNEVKCRNELHHLQMENEKKKATILNLKKTLLLQKIEYFNKQNSEQ